MNSVLKKIISTLFGVRAPFSMWSSYSPFPLCLSVLVNITLQKSLSHPLSFSLSFSEKQVGILAAWKKKNQKAPQVVTSDSVVVG